jgi:lysophospholipase L1-like esterase
MWSNIQWINGELEKQCKLQRNCYYMDSGDLFLRTNDNKDELEVDYELMEDGLHPNVAGCAAWVPFIVAEVNKLILPGAR